MGVVHHNTNVPLTTTWDLDERCSRRHDLLWGKSRGLVGLAHKSIELQPKFLKLPSPFPSQYSKPVVSSGARSVKRMCTWICNSWAQEAESFCCVVLLESLDKMLLWLTGIVFSLPPLEYIERYGSNPVWFGYRRNHKGQIPPQKTRKTCIVSVFLSLFFCDVCQEN